MRGTQEELIRQRCRSTKLQVEYNIMLSPTYQVPILYFFVHNVINNSNISAKGPEGLLDIVYNRLVPTQYRSELKDVGIMGGLSIGVCLFMYHVSFLSLDLSLAMCLQPSNARQRKKKTKKYANQTAASPTIGPPGLLCSPLQHPRCIEGCGRE